MASTTFTANGKTFKTTSNRRYALVVSLSEMTYYIPVLQIDPSTGTHLRTESGEYVYGEELRTRPACTEITKRSDNLTTISKEMHKWGADKRCTLATIIDTTTGEMVANCGR